MQIFSNIIKRTYNRTRTWHENVDVSVAHVRLPAAFALGSWSGASMRQLCEGTRHYLSGKGGQGQLASLGKENSKVSLRIRCYVLRFSVACLGINSGILS